MRIKWFNICEVLKTVAHTVLTIVIVVDIIVFLLLNIGNLAHWYYHLPFLAPFSQYGYMMSSAALSNIT